MILYFIPMFGMDLKTKLTIGQLTTMENYIDHISIDSTVNDYKLKITIDDHVLWNNEKSYTWFVSNDILFPKFTTSGVGDILIEDIYFSKSFRIEYTPITAGTFNIIACRYNIREDRIVK